MKDGTDTRRLCQCVGAEGEEAQEGKEVQEGEAEMRSKEHRVITRNDGLYRG